MKHDATTCTCDSCTLQRAFERSLCGCGSGERRYELTDARGIFCCYVCTQCEAGARARFRADIFTDANYWADEPIEEDE